MSNYCTFNYLSFNKYICVCVCFHFLNYTLLLLYFNTLYRIFSRLIAKNFFLSERITNSPPLFLRVHSRRASAGHPVDAPCRDMDSLRDRCRGCLTFLARREIYGQSSVSRPGECAEKKKDEGKERAAGAPNAAKLITGRCIHGR